MCALLRRANNLYFSYGGGETKFLQIILEGFPPPLNVL